VGNRRQAREAALGFLYQWDSQVSPLTETPKKFIAHFKVAEPFQSYFINLVNGTMEKKEEIDGELSGVAENWKLSRMARVDRNILRMSIWELMTQTETSHKIIIDEAVELAKTYGSQDSGKFVNGILDKLAKKYREL